ncbi:hypothetical protein ACJJTC_007674 [Scirpophaga incertulas]
MTLSPPEAPNRLQKARNTLQSGKKFLGDAKNLKGTIKTGATTALESLFQSVKEAENERKRMEEVIKENEGRLAEYERLVIGKEGEECEKGWKEKHEENDEMVKELESRMEEWREKYMEKERKLRKIEKEVEEFGMSCARCEDAHIQKARLERTNKELRDLRYGEADDKIRLLMDARDKSDRQRNEAFDETDRATADYDRMEKEGVKAKNSLQSGKKYLGEAKNLKTTIKTGATAALDSLFQSVKEAESERKRMEEVIKENEGRLAEYERLVIGKEGEECEKEWKEKHEENDEMVKELESRMEEWREKYMEKERKLRKIEKEVEEYGMSCARCEDAHIQMSRLERINKELKDLRYGEADEKIRLLMDARDKSDRQRNEAFDETDRATADYDRMEKEGVGGSSRLRKYKFDENRSRTSGKKPRKQNCEKNKEPAKTRKQLFPGPYPENYSSSPPVSAHHKKGKLSKNPATPERQGSVQAKNTALELSLSAVTAVASIHKRSAVKREKEQRRTALTAEMQEIPRRHTMPSVHAVP